MMRDDWEFEYTAKNVAIAAAAQRDFRMDRVSFWEAKKAEVMKKIRDSGMEVHESIVDQLYANSGKFSTQNIGRNRPHIVIDTQMQSDLDECVNKLAEHRDLLKQYTAWVQVLEANGEQRVRLDHDDWVFFFGR